jgi:hypothetical protein
LPEPGAERVFSVAVRSPLPSWFIGSDVLVRALDMNYLTLHELLAKNFLYKLFNWVVQLHQLELGQTFVHASAITRGGRSLAVLGKGGVGKTSAMIKLCMEDGWQYLSDDLAAIDDSGIVYRSPARIQIYAYNTKGDPMLEQRLMDRRSALDHLQWSLRRRLLGPSKVRRRVPAEFLFGVDGVGSSAKLTDLVFLERVPSAGLSVKDTTAAEVAERMAPIVMNEIKSYVGVQAQAEQRARGLLPSPAEVESRTREALERASSHAAAKLMSAGPEIGPNDLADALRRMFEASASSASVNAPTP